MADFSQAVIWMQEGRKVCISSRLWYAIIAGSFIRIYDTDGNCERECIVSAYSRDDWEIFEEDKWSLDKAYEKFISENKTSHKWLARKGMEDAEHFGDCIFIDYQGVEDRKDRLREFIDEVIKNHDAVSEVSE